MIEKNREIKTYYNTPFLYLPFLVEVSYNPYYWLCLPVSQHVSLAEVPVLYRENFNPKQDYFTTQAKRLPGEFYYCHFWNVTT